MHPATGIVHPCDRTNVEAWRQSQEEHPDRHLQAQSEGERRGQMRGPGSEMGKEGVHFRDFADACL